MQSSTSPARPRGRPARETAPAATPDAVRLNTRSIVSIDSTPIYSETFHREHADIVWRDDLDRTEEQIAADTANARACLAEVKSALADTDVRKTQTTARLEECRAAAAAGPGTIDLRKADVAAGRCTLEDLVITKARADMAREILPTISAAYKDLEIEYRDLEKSSARARRDLRNLEAAQAWQTLQAAIAPVQGAIAAWLESTGDAALYIEVPR